MNETEIGEGANEIEDPALRGPIEAGALPITQRQEPSSVVLSGTDVVAFLKSVLGA